MSTAWCSPEVSCPALNCSALNCSGINCSGINCSGVNCSGLIFCPGILLTVAVLARGRPGCRPRQAATAAGAGHPAPRCYPSQRGASKRPRLALARASSAGQQAVDEHSHQALSLTWIGRCGIGSKDQAVTQAQDVSRPDILAHKASLLGAI